jgi:hypothetical protein
MVWPRATRKTARKRARVINVSFIVPVYTMGSSSLVSASEARCEGDFVSVQDWDVEATMHVGFEYLVPALSNMLQSENIHFDFKRRNILMSINEKKISRFQPAFLYAEMKITALRSLETFIGLIDLDRVKHHKPFGNTIVRSQQ